MEKLENAGAAPLARPLSTLPVPKEDTRVRAKRDKLARALKRNLQRRKQAAAAPEPDA